MRRVAIGFALACGCAVTPDDGVAGDDSGGGTDTGDVADDEGLPASDEDADDDGGPTVESSEDGTPESSTGADETTDDAGDDDPAESSGHAADEGGASVECTALMDCCDQLGADIYTGCVTVVDLEMPALCDSTLSTYHQEGYCTGETFCADLGDCCGELPPGPGWEETCTYYADLGNQPQCAMLIGDYQLSGYCF